MCSDCAPTDTEHLRTPPARARMGELQLLCLSLVYLGERFMSSRSVGGCVALVHAAIWDGLWVVMGSPLTMALEAPNGTIWIRRWDTCTRRNACRWQDYV